MDSEMKMKFNTIIEEMGNIEERTKKGGYKSCHTT